jgi:hypothetical protein
MTPDKQIMMGRQHGKSRLLEELVSTMTPFQKKYIWGDSEITEATKKLREYNRLWGTAPTMVGHRADMIIVDDVAAELQRIEEDAMNDQPNEHHCHLCFAPRARLKKVETVTPVSHYRERVLVYECGTTVVTTREENKDESGEWHENPIKHEVVRGKKCL